SPRAWGLPGPGGSTDDLERSIPTCVGPAAETAVASRPVVVHPHVRGACAQSLRTRPRWNGPSPRAWGLRFIRSGFGVVLRSIPTCVGPAPSVTSYPHNGPVHPHVRGACTDP